MASLNSLKTNGINNDSGVITTDNSGALSVAKILLTAGSLKRVVKFTGSSIVGKVSVNPNMTDVPDLVLIVYNVTSTPSAATIAINYATLSATNIDIWSNLAAPFVGIAITF